MVKTLASVNIRTSKIEIARQGTENAISVEIDLHFKGSTVLCNGSSRENYTPFDDEPKAEIKLGPPACPGREKKVLVRKDSC